MTGPEFSRRISLADIGREREIAIEADGRECAALAERFGLVSIQSLSATAELHAKVVGIEARGTIRAGVTQSCVASGAPVEQSVEEPFHILFIAPGEPGGDEIEISAEDCDQMEHDGQAVDLGEAAAQTLALALDPFPRARDAEAVLAEAGVVPEGEEATGPFAALKALKK